MECVCVCVFVCEGEKETQPANVTNLRPSMREKKQKTK